MLMFHVKDKVKSQDKGHKPQVLRERDSQSGLEPTSACWPALPLGHTGSP